MAAIASESSKVTQKVDDKPLTPNDAQQKVTQLCKLQASPQPAAHFKKHDKKHVFFDKLRTALDAQ